MTDGADIVQVKNLRTPADLQARIAHLGIALPVDEVVEVGPSHPASLPRRAHPTGGARTDQE